MSWFGSSQSSFHLSHLGLSILDGQLAMMLGIHNGGLQGSPLVFEAMDLSLDSADAPFNLRNLCLHATQVIPMLPS